ncbi:MAG: putative rane protein [Acidobacteriaceae bacterium]|nr:putative rane protein [Acidobacteriaceae bacterium]
MSEANTAANKALAIEAITGAFIRRDVTMPEKIFVADYKQHNPTIPNGSASIPDVIRALPDDFKYEMGMVVAEGEYVMIHGRYTGWAPKPVVAVDIFRIVDGKLVEHWDVMQEEVPAEKTVSGNPMFTPGA